MSYIISLLLFLLFLFYFIKKNADSIKRQSLLLAIAVKILASISVWYIYTYYFYNTSLNDIYKYFNYGKILNDSFTKNPIETLKFIINGKSDEIRIITSKLQYWTKPNQYGLLNDNQTIILINFLLCFVSNNNLLIQSIIIASISFYATLVLYRSVQSHYAIPNKILFLFMFFNPTYLIWTSGNFKETFIYIGLMFLFSNLIRLQNNSKNNKLHLFIFINLIFILFCKNYFFIFLIPGIIALYLNIYIWKNVKIISLSYIIFLLVIIFAGLFHNPVNFDNNIKDPIKRKLYIKKVNSESYEKNALGQNRNIFEVLRFKQRDQQFEARKQNAHTVIYAPTLDGNPITFLKCIPFGILNTLFRPNIIDLKNPLFIPDIFLNLIVIILILFSIKFRKSKFSDKEKLLANQILFFSIISLILIGILVPVLGNIVRYRAPIIPLLIIALLTMIDFEKIPLLNKL